MIPLLGWAVAAGIGAAVGALVAVALLEYTKIKEWFHANTYVDKDHVRAVFQQAMANGDYKVVQCGFNRKTKELTAVKGWQAKERDQELIAKGPAAIITEEC